MQAAASEVAGSITTVAISANTQASITETVSAQVQEIIGRLEEAGQVITEVADVAQRAGVQAEDGRDRSRQAAADSRVPRTSSRLSLGKPRIVLRLASVIAVSRTIRFPSRVSAASCASSASVIRVPSRFRQ